MFEYLCESLPAAQGLDASDVTKWLNKHGQTGWELVYFEPQDPGYFTVFKRPLTLQYEIDTPD